jgi:hypothetical protein
MGRSLSGAALRVRWLRGFDEASPTRRWTILFLAACSAMAVGAVAAWQITCDRDPCTGVRVLWSAWTTALIVVLVSGALLRDRVRAEARSLRWVHIGIVAMLLIALWLAGYWLGHAR